MVESYTEHHRRKAGQCWAQSSLFVVTHQEAGGGRRLFLAPLGNKFQNVTAGCHSWLQVAQLPCHQEKRQWAGKCSQLGLPLQLHEPPAPRHGPSGWAPALCSSNHRWVFTSPGSTGVFGYVLGQGLLQALSQEVSRSELTQRYWVSGLPLGAQGDASERSNPNFPKDRVHPRWPVLLATGFTISTSFL